MYTYIYIYIHTCVYSIYIYTHIPRETDIYHAM